MELDNLLTDTETALLPENLDKLNVAFESFKPLWKNLKKYADENPPSTESILYEVKLALHKTLSDLSDDIHFKNDISPEDLLFLEATLLLPKASSVKASEADKEFFEYDIFNFLSTALQYPTVFNAIKNDPWFKAVLQENPSDAELILSSLSEPLGFQVFKSLKNAALVKMPEDTTAIISLINVILRSNCLGVFDSIRKEAWFKKNALEYLRSYGLGEFLEKISLVNHDDISARTLLIQKLQCDTFGSIPATLDEVLASIADATEKLSKLPESTGHLRTARLSREYYSACATMRYWIKLASDSKNFKTARRNEALQISDVGLTLDERRVFPAGTVLEQFDTKAWPLAVEETGRVLSAVYDFIIELDNKLLEHRHVFKDFGLPQASEEKRYFFSVIAELQRTLLQHPNIQAALQEFQKQAVSAIKKHYNQMITKNIPRNIPDSLLPDHGTEYGPDLKVQPKPRYLDPRISEAIETLGELNINFMPMLSFVRNKPHAVGTYFENEKQIHIGVDKEPDAELYSTVFHEMLHLVTNLKKGSFSLEKIASRVDIPQLHYNPILEYANEALTREILLRDNYFLNLLPKEISGTSIEGREQRLQDANIFGAYQDLLETARQLNGQLGLVERDFTKALIFTDARRNLESKLHKKGMTLEDYAKLLALKIVDKSK